MSQKILKFIVIFLGILIVICFLALVYGLYIKTTKKQSNLETNLIDYNLNLEKGHKITDIDMIDNKQINEVDMTSKYNKQTIDYVGVSDGNDSFGFYFTTKENDDIVYTNSWLLKDLVFALRTKYNLGSTYMGSSSMDFATESGFYHNGAASHVLTLASNIAESGKTIAEYTKKKLTENVDMREIEFGGLKKEEAEDWYTEGKVAFNN